MTSPARSAAKGRQRRAGSPPSGPSASRRAAAPERAKPVMATGKTIDSVAPAIAMSHWPSASMSRATERAVTPEEQAVQGARLGPVAFIWMAISAAGMLGMVSRMPEGEVASGPRRSRATACSVSPAEPPLLVPTTTATRAPSQWAGSSPASATASRAARTANLTYRPIRKALRPPTAPSRSMPVTVQAKSTAQPCSSGTVRAKEPPRQTPSQVVSVVWPAGVIMPRPVTAMAGRFIGCCSPAPHCPPPRRRRPRR